ncbi:conserved hypothetical protein [Pseudoalteromonas luteoviolacea B = ATCC 29581]|nr:conserved hypothetical protein [Pseudoalteromonas luteoviolacea B = ATCC 29581]
MCGRLNITDDPMVTQTLLDLGVANPYEKKHLGRFIRATNQLSIVLQENHQPPRIQSAAWWLLQEPTETGFKPSKYTSFNSRYDKLHVRGSAAYQPYRSNRCIVVANGFGETLSQGKKALHYYDFYAEQPLLLAGLYKTWYHPKKDTPFYSCSIITLPPHPKLQPFHDKASPMMLPNDNALLLAWLDPLFSQVTAFEFLLQPTLHQSLTVQEIDKPSSYHPIGEAHYLMAD